MRQMCSVPTDSGLKPIFGSSTPGLVDFARATLDRDAWIHRRRDRYGDVWFTTLFGRKCVLPSTPQAAETVLMNKGKVFASEPAWNFMIGMAFRRGLLLMDFDEHLSQRRIFQQAFTPNSMKGYLREMQPLIADRVTTLRTGDVRLTREFKSIVLDTALEVFVGVHLTRAEAERVTGAFLDCLSGPTAMVRHPVPGGKWRRALRGRRVLQSFFDERLPEKHRRETPDLFSVLCHARSEEGDRLTDEQIVNHMIFLLFAAHDTSTIALSTMAYHMAKSRQWQDRARHESMRLPADLTYDALGDMSTLDLILKESLRLNSPVPLLAREALRDTELDGHYVPKGAFVFVAPEAVHSNPTVWPRPQDFDPERFHPDRAEDKIHRFAWFPFGGGVHKCIGVYFAQMEIKTLMHHLLRNFEWSVSDDYQWRLDPRTLGEPVHGLPARLTRL